MLNISDKKLSFLVLLTQLFCDGGYLSDRNHFRDESNKSFFAPHYLFIFSLSFLFLPFLSSLSVSQLFFISSFTNFNLILFIKSLRLISILDLYLSSPFHLSHPIPSTTIHLNPITPQTFFFQVQLNSEQYLSQHQKKIKHRAIQTSLQLKKWEELDLIYRLWKVLSLLLQKVSYSSYGITRTYATSKNILFSHVSCSIQESIKKIEVDDFSFVNVFVYYNWEIRTIIFLTNIYQLPLSSHC